jgi:hypothetical protein
MISAAEAQLVGWPLPASVVARTESMRSRVAFSCSIFNVSCTDVSTSSPHSYDFLGRQRARGALTAWTEPLWPLCYEPGHFQSRISGLSMPYSCA